MAIPIATSRGHGDKKPRLTERFIQNLLIQPTVEAAARETGISVRTASRWIAEPTFAKAWAFARRNALEHATNKLSGASDTAVNALIQVASRGEPDTARVAAARAILEYGHIAVANEDLSDRLAALEERNNL
jgi:hypothetical protein